MPIEVLDGTLCHRGSRGGGGSNFLSIRDHSGKPVNTSLIKTSVVEDTFFFVGHIQFDNDHNVFLCRSRILGMLILMKKMRIKQMIKVCCPDQLLLHDYKGKLSYYSNK